VSRDLAQAGTARRAARLGVALLCAALWCASLATGPVACSGPERVRKAQSRQSLIATRDAADQKLREEQVSSITRNLARIKAEFDDYSAGRAASPPVVDLLIVSGGGDWGAFGAGFLKGWGKVPAGEMARPSFDAVTGVSTGALIAPFAFLGDDESIEKVVGLYRNPKKDWVKPRGILAILNGGAAFADIPGLEREMAKALDLPTLQRIAEAGSTGRILAVSATNIDTEEMCVWYLGDEARLAAARGDARALRQKLLASAAVPGVFPPRHIDGGLYVDGGVTGNILCGAPRARYDEDSFVARWRSTYPDVPVPRIRYWVLFNNEVRWPPEVVQPKWSSVLLKSSTAATRAATLNAMRQLFLQAELAKLKHGADVEVRFAAVPDGWVAPQPRPFDKQTMNALADLGERMGADPASWRTEPP
jgi:predicted acylesterase/phospholipase RssA